MFQGENASTWPPLSLLLRSGIRPQSAVILACLSLAACLVVFAMRVMSNYDCAQGALPASLSEVLVATRGKQVRPFSLRYLEASTLSDIGKLSTCAKEMSLGNAKSTSLRSKRRTCWNPTDCSR